jgi:hypothetical protein
MPAGFFSPPAAGGLGYTVSYTERRNSFRQLTLFLSSGLAGGLLG